ncbi:hypothetical protein Dsin_010736 [Dipteronia sinensis]|uniref:Uncharacterized protein n=1 Tax=Dipteronia sinensis TaxID=43782 RepID=A0AAE0AT38_9ROSI|nr:hypothetical protein Dsin_010736 [Dipteronia sinensis]
MVSKSGRYKDSCFIDCDDQGIPFVEATVNCPLSQVIASPVPAQLNKLLPLELDDPQQLVLGIQFNSFKCGGTVISVCIFHNIADAASVFTFVKSWAASTRGSACRICIRHSLSSKELIWVSTAKSYHKREYSSKDICV